MPRPAVTATSVGDMPALQRDFERFRRAARPSPRTIGTYREGIDQPSPVVGLRVNDIDFDQEGLVPLGLRFRFWSGLACETGAIARVPHARTAGVSGRGRPRC